jgi:riboflavin synthase
MFTGIIETIGEVVALQKQNANIQITVKSSISKELKPDQSLSHNGVCLTVVEANKNTHTAEAVNETLQRTNLGNLKEGSPVNLERAMRADGRFDGHFVQGHVDLCGTCIKIENKDGSRKVWISFKPSDDFAVVKKGSICVDGVSLTVVDAKPTQFSVVIIPYTLGHTCFQYLKEGNLVNLEFDILGKYVKKSLGRC